MAIMIPSVISPSVKSVAERKIFDWFKTAPDTDDWIVLHSLGITNHNRVIYGEVDFLVIAPDMGLFALEVKGGRVRRENGIWYFTNRYGITQTKSRGPFDQAKDSIFSIIKILKSRYDSEHQHLANVFYSYGVMFPDIVFPASGVEEEQWQVFDAADNTDVKSYIYRLFEHSKEKWEEKYTRLNKNKLPNKDDVKYITSLLRGDFDCIIPLKSQLESVNEELLSLTKEQYNCLDQIEDNFRCLIQGPAGTGKTLIAIEDTKRAVANGDRVALICFNANLADWITEYFNNIDENLRPNFVGTLHSFMTRVSKTAGLLPPFPSDEKLIQQYYQNHLPLAAIMAKDNESILFDKIIIDEAQDIINDNYLRVLDTYLKKGLGRGRWTMFGDFSSQAIYSNLSFSEMRDKLEDYGYYINFKLKTNCRNTKQICKEIETVTGFSIPHTLLTTVDGPPVQYITWDNQKEQSEKLKNLLDSFKNDNINPSDITILSPIKRENSIVSALKEYDIKNYSAHNKSHISFCTIQAYKGLESKIIILVDIDGFSEDKLMYVGFSRAQAGLYILESDKAKKEYDEIIIKRLLL